MKKNITKNLPKKPEKPASNVRNYYTEDILKQIAEMSEKEMEGTLKDMISSRTWIAFLKYNGMRMPSVDALLRSLDPVREPSKISWAQGVMAGLCDVESYIIDLNAPKKPEDSNESPANEKPEGVIVG